MKKLLCLLALLPGCQPAAQPKPEAVRDEQVALSLAMALGTAYDASQLRPGQWALYSINKTGVQTTWFAKMQVVDEDPVGLWIELKVPNTPFPMVIKSRIDRTGKLLEAWTGEAGSKGPRQTYPYEGAPPAAPRGPEMRANVTVTDETISVIGRAWVCKKVATKNKFEGHETSIITWCSPGIPFSYKLGADALGGIVRRTYEAFTMELSDMGTTGVRSELDIPKH